MVLVQRGEGRVGGGLEDGRAYGVVAASGILSGSSDMWTIF